MSLSSSPTFSQVPSHPLRFILALQAVLHAGNDTGSSNSKALLSQVQKAFDACTESERDYSLNMQLQWPIPSTTRDLTLCIDSENGRPPLYQLLAQRHYDLARWLINRGADTNIKTADGSPLLMAIIATASGIAKTASGSDKSGIAGQSLGLDQDRSFADKASKSPVSQSPVRDQQSGMGLSSSHPNQKPAFGSSPSQGALQGGLSSLEKQREDDSMGHDSEDTDGMGYTNQEKGIYGYSNGNCGDDGHDGVREDDDEDDNLDMVGRNGYMSLSGNRSKSFANPFTIKNTNVFKRPSIPGGGLVSMDAPSSWKSWSTKLKKVEWNSQADVSSDMVKYLLEHGASPNATDAAGTSVLSAACRIGHIGIVYTLLLDFSADPHMEDSNGQSPLHIAASNGVLPIIEMLLSRKVLPDYMDHEGKTPLMEACRANQIDAVKLLVQKGANVKAQSQNGMTPLHYAVAHGNMDLVIALVDFGADVNQENTSNKTAHDLALEHNETEIASYLSIYSSGIYSTEPKEKKTTKKEAKGSPTFISGESYYPEGVEEEKEPKSCLIS